jgi:hypothetical protein
MRHEPTSLTIPDDVPSVLARAMRLSGFPAAEIAAFAFSPFRQNRTRCIIWRWHGPQIEKYYFYTKKGAAAND